MNDETMKGQPHRVHFGPFEADLGTQELWRSGARLKLSGQPFQVLAMLLGRPGQLVTREELQAQLWPTDVFSDSNHGLNAAVNKLRETLNESANDPKYIETLPRRGYRFIGTVQSDDERESSTHIGSETDKILTRVQPASTPTPVVYAVPPRRTPWPPALIAMMTVVGLVIGIIVSTQTHRGEEEQAEARAKNPAQPEPASRRAEVSRDQTSQKEPGPSRARTLRATRANTDSPPAVFREADLPVPAVHTIISDGSGNAAPQFSPDGKRIAFMSNRSGPWQIWVSDADGSHPVQVSFTDSAGTPRWSPDGRWITFDAPCFDGTCIYVTSSEGGGRARKLVEGQVPSFSRDGERVYFASDEEVWRVALDGGHAEQVTHHGGFAALESSDGYIYYSRSPGQNPEICRIPRDGGEEDCALPHLRPRTWSSWAVTKNGILFAEDLPGGKSALSLYEPAKREVRDLIALPSGPVWMGARADGLAAVVNDASERQISVVLHLR